MMERIDLAPLLREAVATPYSDLVTRPTGAAVRGRIEQRMATSVHPTMQLDFSAIGLLDFSCADEVVAKLLLNECGGHPCCVVLLGVKESHRETLDHVLERHRLTVAAIPAEEGRPCVLGWRTPDLVAAFHAVRETGAGDAGRLAEALGWTVERAADALLSLSLRRLVLAAGGTYRPLPFARR